MSAAIYVIGLFMFIQRFTFHQEHGFLKAYIFIFEGKFEEVGLHSKWRPSTDATGTSGRSKNRPTASTMSMPTVLTKGGSISSSVSDDNIDDKPPTATKVESKSEKEKNEKSQPLSSSSSSSFSSENNKSEAP